MLVCGAGALSIMFSRGAFQHFDLGYIRPALLAMLGAALFAFEGILIKLLSQSDRPMVVLVYVNVFGLMMLSIPAFIFWKPLPLADMLCYMLLGPLGLPDNIAPSAVIAWPRFPSSARSITPGWCLRR